MKCIFGKIKNGKDLTLFFIAEEVNGAGHEGSVQITQDNIMGSLGILDVTDAKPSGLGTIFFNCQS
jgi:hypothetical protein